MDKNEFFGEIERQKRKNRLYQFMLLCSGVTILIMASTIRAQTGETKTAFVPPEIKRPFWISSEDASQEYFEDLGQFINGLPLNVTPETVGMACKQYLTYVLPRDRDKYKKRCDTDEIRVKRDGASQMFAIREVRTDVKNRRVAFTGDLVTIINGKSFSPVTETYLLEFAHADGRFYLSNHEKVDTNDPFAQKK